MGWRCTSLRAAGRRSGSARHPAAPHLGCAVERAAQGALHLAGSSRVHQHDPALRVGAAQLRRVLLRRRRRHRLLRRRARDVATPSAPHVVRSLQERGRTALSGARGGRLAASVPVHGAPVGT